MCTRDGTTYAKIQAMSRRGFLGAAAAGAVRVALPASVAMMLPGVAQAQTRVKATHGFGLCNMGIFLAKERQLARADGVDIDFVVTPNTSDVATLFGAGQVDVSVVPYSNFLTLYDAGAPVTIVAGGGAEGCIMVAAKGIKQASDLKGKTIGTFQADTLEVLPYDYLKKAGLSFKDVKVRYFSNPPELAQAFIAGAIDAASLIEPYASQCVASRKGSTVLTDGTDVYPKLYSDCMLAARNSLIAKNPEVIKAIIKAMMVAQSQAEKDIDAALKSTVGVYYKTTFEATKLAALKQPIMIDQRQNEQFILDRATSMKEMGYVKKPVPKTAMNWSLLQQVIAENKPLYSSLKVKSEI